ncbi:hypothetical protein MP228_002275 [Amoeboaphelidium protococcarum]|nr:hypothetical protein MP228_002275 [Amoeboaphelidium protococcarum]
MVPIHVLITAACLAPVLALNAPKYDPSAGKTCFRSAGYWGQNTVGIGQQPANYEKRLSAYCDDTTWDIVIVSFLHILKHGPLNLPGLNFAYHCENTPFPSYPWLLVCDQIAQDITYCQKKGKIILLSIGGATGNGVFSSEQDGAQYADTLWAMFGAGSDPNIPRALPGSIVDGFDLDIEGGSPVGYTGLTNRLRELYATDLTRTYYVGGAPQCVFPDAYLGPTGSGPNYVLSGAYLDFIFVQFYNNFCGIQNFDTRFFNFEEWNTWAKQSKTQVFLGVPGSATSGGGYQGADKVQSILQNMIDLYGPAAGGYFAGFMTWDIGSSSANMANGMSFAKQQSSFLKGKSDPGACDLVVNPPPPPPPTSSTRTQSSTTSSSTSTRVTMTSTSTSSSPSPTVVIPPPPPPPAPGCQYSGPPSSGPGGLWYKLDVEGSNQDIDAMTTTTHLSSSLRFDQDKLDEQFDEVLQWSGYDDPSLYKPFSGPDSQYFCSLIAPQAWYEKNPTQMFIGFPDPDKFVRISSTDINVRLLDKQFGLFLAYAMDQYGMNPHAFMSLSAKESFAPAVSPNGPDAQRMFLTMNEMSLYNLYGLHYGFGTDANGDGPFQNEMPTMATTVSMFPGRFALTYGQQQPSFDLDVTIAASPQLPQLHSFYVQQAHRAVVLAALDLHWRYNAYILVPGFGMRAPWQKRSNGKQKSELEFAALFYSYNRGVYSDISSKLCGCQPEADPLLTCGMNGFGTHGSDIKSVCKLMDSATKVYDYQVSRRDLHIFLDLLRSTYPYSEQGAASIYGPINWNTIFSVSNKYFGKLAERRQAKGGVKRTFGPPTGLDEEYISFRYDWRLLLAVIRAFLPERESLVGPTWQGMVQWSFGKTVATDPGFNFNPDNLPFKNFQAEAGNRSYSGPYVEQVTTTPTQTVVDVESTSASESSSTSASDPVSSSVTSTSSVVDPQPSPPPITSSDCTCPAQDGFAEVSAPGFSTKRCPPGSFGIVLRVCSQIPPAENNNCQWGVERPYCLYRNSTELVNYRNTTSD